LNAPAIAEDRIPAGEPESYYVDVDPRALILKRNVRIDTKVDAEFVESIRERGVLQPIVAFDNGGDLEVLIGHRRTLGAIAAERATVPVRVMSAPEDVDRLVDQLVENDHREAVTPADRVHAYDQLTLLGVPAGEIARRTARPRADVDAALAVAASKSAKAVVNRYAFLTLAQGAAVAEFDDDKETVKALVAAAGRGVNFDYVLSRARDNRESARAKADLLAKLESKGVTVVEYTGAMWRQSLDNLIDVASGEQLTKAKHRKCPGRAVYLTEKRSGNGWDAVDICVDPKANGHRDRWGSDSAGARKAEDAEKAKQERREVRENNAAWRTGEKVRRDWLRAFLTRKAAPKGAAAFLASCLASSDDYQISSAREKGNTVAHLLFGLPEPAKGWRRGEQEGTGLDSLVTASTSEARAQMVALGIVLCAYEEMTDTNSWRYRRDGTARYLRFLEANGYALSPVEELACQAAPATEFGDPDPDAEDGDDEVAEAAYAG